MHWRDHEALREGIAPATRPATPPDPEYTGCSPLTNHRQSHLNETAAPAILIGLNIDERRLASRPPLFANGRTGMKTLPDQGSLARIEQQNRDARFAMRLSLFVGLFMLISKVAAYLFTGSSAIFSDAAESVVHVFAVAFAVFSLWLSTRPAVPKFHYGYERITFFSAGFEGAMIVLAAASIIVTTTQKWRHGLVLEHLGNGVALILAAGVLNALLGWYLLRVGKRNHSLILDADGKHVLTDSLTSFGVVAGLGLVMITGWKPFDPLVAYAIAANILWSGGRLMWHSIEGLLDYSDPRIGHQIRNRLDVICAELGTEYHGVRFRTTGHRQIIEVHLLFPHTMQVGEAHRLATILEERLTMDLEVPAEVTTHLESLEDHSQVHRVQHYTGRPD
jgi:cation diffusion facilitator family transporter